MRGYQYDISYQYDIPRRFDIVRFRITHIRNNETFCNIQAIISRTMISRTMINRTMSCRSFLRPSRTRPFLLGWAQNTLFPGLCDAASCRPAMRAGRHPG
jgi:predicted DNA-binding transcriptional regulator AlpA